jgi:hypothetical protein
VQAIASEPGLFFTVLFKNLLKVIEAKQNVTDKGLIK